MRLYSHSLSLFPSIICLLPTFITALTIDCKNIRVDKKSFNLKALDGPHTVGWVDVQPQSTTSYAFTIDLCKSLKKVDDGCPNGARVCGIEHNSTVDENGSPVVKIRPIAIAGDFIHENSPLHPIWTRLKSSTDPGDTDKEGLRLKMDGKVYNGKKQKTVVEFICDAKEREQKRGLSASLQVRDDEDGGEDVPKLQEEVDDGAGGKLKFINYDDVEKSKVLSLKWTTPYACENFKDGSEPSSSTGHWGFFTWLIIIVFLGTAAYLIFGTWLNYNRYSARGWDLVPHSETIRDLPYLLRDWMRRVVNTIQGGGSRGGYSAV